MNTYRILTQTKEYKTIKYEDTPIIDNMNEQVWKNITEISNYPFQWEKESERKKSCDAPFIAGFIPVISWPVYLHLEKMIHPKECQVIPIQVNGCRYCILNPLIQLDNLLNERQSQIKRFSNGRIMEIRDYVFNNINIPPIFKISQYPVYTFVNETIATILRNEAIGITIEKCKTKKIFKLF